MGAIFGGVWGADRLSDAFDAAFTAAESAWAATCSVHRAPAIGHAGAPTRRCRAWRLQLQAHVARGLQAQHLMEAIFDDVHAVHQVT